MSSKKKDEEAKGWRAVLERAVINDSYWSVKAVMFEAAGGDQDRLYLTKFENFASYEKRYVIKSINRSETMFMINQLGGEKKVKDSVHHHPVFEEAGSYLREKKDIPPDVMALVIKYLILKMKEDYLFIARQKLQVKEGLKRESAIMVAKEVIRDTVVSLPAAPDPNTSPVTPKGKSKKSKDTDMNVPIELEDGKKYNTPLRVRGEEWRDRSYIDDFPIDGPKIYVAISSFLDPLLASCLLTLGIPIAAIIQINIDPLLENIPPSLSKVSKRLPSNVDVGTEHYIGFWKSLQQLRLSRETAPKFTNTAFIVFAPPYWTEDKLTGNPDIVYDEMSYMMYDVQDLTRQHAHYLDNMQVYDVPVHTPVFDTLRLYYTEYIEDIPSESTSILAIVDSMINTIIHGSRNKDNNTSATEHGTARPDSSGEEMDTKQKKAHDLVRDVFNSLCQGHDEVKHYRVTYGDEFELFENPKILLFGDLAKYKVFHLNHVNLDKAILNMLFAQPINLLWRHHQQAEAEHAAKISYHVNLLRSCFDGTDIETTELIRLIHILTFRKLYNNRSSMHHRQNAVTKTMAEFKNVFLKRSVLVNPLPSNTSITAIHRKHNPYFYDCDQQLEKELEDKDEEFNEINTIFKCPDLAELPLAAEITQGMPIQNFVDNYEYFEDFSGHVGFQRLMEAFSNFSCVDYKYCEVTENLLLMFYNSHNQNRISKEEWRAHIPTPVCLEDFFDYVLDEVYDWVRAEEELYNQTTGPETLSVADSSKICSIIFKSCLSESDVADDLLIAGSLKHQDRLALVQTEDGSKPADQLSVLCTASDTKSTKKLTAVSTPKTKSIKTEKSDSAVTIPIKPFWGYDLGDRRIEAFGKDFKYFAYDGTRVTSKFFSFIPDNVDYNFLNVQTGNGKNNFWSIKVKPEPMNSPTLESYWETLRISRKNNLTIFFKKISFKVPPAKNIDDAAVKIHSVIDDLKLPPPEIKIFYSLYISWPTELVIETVYDNNSTSIAHVKQQYLRDTMNIMEDCRCYNLKGEIVVFKSNGHIMVMRPDSTYMTITKAYKRPVYVESPLLKGDKKENKKPEKIWQIAKEDDSPISKKKPEDTLIFEDFEVISGDGTKEVYFSGLFGYNERLLIRTATDFGLGEVFSRRMDGTNTLMNKDGTLVATFPDGTRIASSFVIEDDYIYPEWTDEEIQLFNIADSSSNVSSSQRTSTQSEMSFMEEQFPETISKSHPEYISIKMVYYMEHTHYATVIVNQVDDTITIENPDKSSVTVDKNNNYTMQLDNETKASFDGETAHVDYDACSKCGFKSTFDIKIRYNAANSALDPQTNWLTMEDSDKNICVNQDGVLKQLRPDLRISNTSLTRNLTQTCATTARTLNFHSSQSLTMRLVARTVGDSSTYPCVHSITKPQRLKCNKMDISIKESANSDEINILKSNRSRTECEGEDNASVDSEEHKYCGEKYLMESMRFFTYSRDLNCSELLHKREVEEYVKYCKCESLCSIDSYDTFGDHPRFESVLRPIHKNIREKWLMNSKLCNMPKRLTLKDLKKDSGKGWYQWMRPYKRFTPEPEVIPPALPPLLPKAFILRTLEWIEERREELKGGQELIKAILKYRQLLQEDRDAIFNVPLIDERTEEDKIKNDMAQALGHKLYTNMCTRLQEEVRNRAKSDITTKPLPYTKPSEIFGEQTYNSLVELNRKAMEHELEEVEAVESLSSNLKRYWRCRAEEYKEEQFHKWILREGQVPPYFLNVLGGAIWWFLNHATEKALRKADGEEVSISYRTEDELDPEPAVNPGPFI